MFRMILQDVQDGGIESGCSGWFYRMCRIEEFRLAPV
jgi:hypothetical protein